MISVPGNLSVREINGRNGKFRVGKLISEIGEFAVKSQLIEEFSEGTYRGIFAISKIFPSSYIYGGRITCEVRADLVSIDLDEIDQSPPPAEQSPEPDPLDEEQATAISAKQKQSNSLKPADQTLTTPARPTNADTSLVATEDTNQHLFGNLWPLAATVKLDPTVGRALLRQQMAYLKDRNYIYDPLLQRWNTPQA